MILFTLNRHLSCLAQMSNRVKGLFHWWRIRDVSFIVSTLYPLKRFWLFTCVPDPISSSNNVSYSGGLHKGLLYGCLYVQQMRINHYDWCKYVQSNHTNFNLCRGASISFTIKVLNWTFLGTWANQMLVKVWASKNIECILEKEWPTLP